VWTDKSKVHDEIPHPILNPKNIRIDNLIFYPDEIEDMDDDAAAEKDDERVRKMARMVEQLRTALIVNIASM